MKITPKSKKQHIWKRFKGNKNPFMKQFCCAKCKKTAPKMYRFVVIYNKVQNLLIIVDFSILQIYNHNIITKGSTGYDDNIVY